MTTKDSEAVLLPDHADLYTVARFVGIPGEKLTAFIGAAEMAGYHVTRNLAQGDGGWMPIETAPKDGTHVLIYAPGWVNGSEARYLEDEGWWLANNDPTDHWGDQQYPTRWRPLPLPPADKGE